MTDPLGVLLHTRSNWIFVTCSFEVCQNKLGMRQNIFSVKWCSWLTLTIYLFVLWGRLKIITSYLHISGWTVHALTGWMAPVGLGVTVWVSLIQLAPGEPFGCSTLTLDFWVGCLPMQLRRCPIAVSNLHFVDPRPIEHIWCKNGFRLL